MEGCGACRGEVRAPDGGGLHRGRHGGGGVSWRSRLLEASAQLGGSVPRLGGERCSGVPARHARGASCHARLRARHAHPRPKHGAAARVVRGPVARQGGRRARSAAARIDNRARLAAARPQLVAATVGARS
eukprot:scaffold42659_cov62-Phaeocystis_antarctica.AAC.3